MTEQTTSTAAAPVNQNRPQTNAPLIKSSNMNDYYTEQFARDVEDFKSNSDLQSGYANLDAITKLYPGLIVIGAVSGLGKTTFVYQMSDQIAESGRHVLYFSLEQSILELASKSITRTIAKENKENRLTSSQIKEADLSDSRIVSAISKCKTYSDKLTIFECRLRATIDYIDDTVRAYVKQHKEKPVVVIDYLQAIWTPPEKKMTTKDKIDYHVQKLKELQIDCQITLIVISALNRQNYLTTIDYESFKESGSIEYTSDVLFGLQFQCIHEALFSKSNTTQKRMRTTEAKLENPRKIELVCLKNRFGISSYSCLFDYYPEFDWFIPDLSNEKNTVQKNTDTSESNTDADGWEIIPDGIGNEIPWDTE